MDGAVKGMVQYKHMAHHRLQYDALFAYCTLTVAIFETHTDLSPKERPKCQRAARNASVLEKHADDVAK